MSYHKQPLIECHLMHYHKHSLKECHPMYYNEQSNGMQPNALSQTILK